MEQKALTRLKYEWNIKFSRLVGFIQLLAGVCIAQFFRAVNAEGKHTLLGWLFLAAAIVFIWIFLDMGTLVKQAVDVFIDIRLHQIDHRDTGQSSHADNEKITNEPTCKSGKGDVDNGSAEIKNNKQEKQKVKKYSAEYWRRHLISHLRYDPATSLEDILLRHSKEVIPPSAVIRLLYMRHQ